MKYSKIVQGAKRFAVHFGTSTIVYSYRKWGFTRYSWADDTGYIDACKERPCTRLLLILPSGKVVQ